MREFASVWLLVAGVAQRLERDRVAGVEKSRPADQGRGTFDQQTTDEANGRDLVSIFEHFADRSGRRDAAHIYQLAYDDYGIVI
jgi:hypothetical protein